MSSMLVVSCLAMSSWAPRMMSCFRSSSIPNFVGGGVVVESLAEPFGEMLPRIARCVEAAGSRVLGRW